MEIKKTFKYIAIAMLGGILLMGIAGFVFASQGSKSEEYASYLDLANKNYARFEMMKKEAEAGMENQNQQRKAWCTLLVQEKKANNEEVKSEDCGLGF